MGDLKACDYERQVRKSAAPYWYMKVSLEYEEGALETDTLQFKHVVMQALTEVFGQIGASETVDLLKLSEEGEALIRVPTRSFVKLWSTLTLFGNYKDQPCAFRVHQVSSNLISLACNSRQFHIHTQS